MDPPGVRPAGRELSSQLLESRASTGDVSVFYPPTSRANLMSTDRMATASSCLAAASTAAAAAAAVAVYAAPSAWHGTPPSEV